jgi:DNA-binding MarR family transcriptional regulator/GNAT superfamily N-acetyltransferase
VLPIPETEVGAIRAASRKLVRELGFLKPTLADTDLPASAVHTIVELGARGSMTATELCEILALEKSSVSRMLRRLIDAGDIREGASPRDGRSKPLSLTDAGRCRFRQIEDFAKRQVAGALATLAPPQHAAVRDGLSLYAQALAAWRTGTPGKAPPAFAIETGYHPGIVGRCTEMHGDFYARTAGFGAVFEAKVATGLAEFTGRLDRPCNALFRAMVDGKIVGTAAIDGEDLGPGIAHLRWFIVGDGVRGGGIGGPLLETALGFVDRQGFDETVLWTFRGLDAARRLYERNGFVLAEEWPGRQWGKAVMEQRFVRKNA